MCPTVGSGPRRDITRKWKIRWKAGRRARPRVGIAEAGAPRRADRAAEHLRLMYKWKKVTAYGFRQAAKLAIERNGRSCAH
jgi:hypothetical protein